MGRRTRLFDYGSFVEGEDGTNILDMLFWDIVKLAGSDKYWILPKGCIKGDDELDFSNYKKGKSSKQYRSKFNGMFDLNGFPFISETAIDEFVNYLKSYNTSVFIYVNDDMTGGEMGYTIDATSSVENGKVIVFIKSEDLDGDAKSAQVKLKYYF